ncbi:MAG: glucosamine-6-phosphate deaminase [Bacillota bacterium]|nr:glucosamine-6-phosphate deaminase [Bacillota bacterium]
MTIQVFENEEQVALAGAALIAAELLQDPYTVLGLPTGSTPIGIYRELIRMFENGVISFAEASAFNLDEYIGLDPDHEQSYNYFLHENFINHVNFRAENVRLVQGLAVNANEECEQYEQDITDAGGIDLQLLGIGRNGHIGFNEPAAWFEKTTHVVDLAADTIAANSRFFANEDEVPRQAISMGIGTIMDAEKIVLAATGSSKAEAIRAMCKGRIDPACPASILQIHPNVTILLDPAAAALI